MLLLHVNTLVVAPSQSLVSQCGRGLKLACLVCVEQQSTVVASGLIKTVDRVMEHMVKNLEPSPGSLISLGGTSFVAGQLSMRWLAHCLSVVCITERHADIPLFLIQRTKAGQITQNLHCFVSLPLPFHLSAPGCWSLASFLLFGVIRSNSWPLPSPTDYSMMKFPQKYNLLHYRFPTEGKNYISVPGEALTMKGKWHFLSYRWEDSLN